MKVTTSNKMELMQDGVLWLDEEEITKTDDMTGEEYTEYQYVTVKLSGEEITEAYEEALATGDQFKAAREYKKREYAKQKNSWLAGVEGDVVKYAADNPITLVEVDVANAAGLQLLIGNKQLAEIANRAEAVLNEYPQYERDSFGAQEQEAIAYNKDNEAVTPLIDSIAEMREIDKQELVDKILVKAAAMKQVIGQLIGSRQLVKG